MSLSAMHFDPYVALCVTTVIMLIIMPKDVILIYNWTQVSSENGLR